MKSLAVNTIVAASNQWK